MNEEAKDIKAPDIERLMIEVAIEKPECFTLSDGKVTLYYYLYPPSLGTSLLTAQLLKKLNISKGLLMMNEEFELIRLCTKQRDTVLRLIAMHTFKRRSDALEEKKIVDRVKELSPLDAAELSGILKVLMSWENQTPMFVKHLGLDKEKNEREKIARHKEAEGNSITYGGKSIYGALLDHAAERYGWELGYIMWGISLTNLNMMLQDSVQSVYLSEEERRKMHIHAKGNVIRADDPRNNAAVEAFLRGA